MHCSKMTSHTSQSKRLPWQRRLCFQFKCQYDIIVKIKTTMIKFTFIALDVYHNINMSCFCFVFSLTKLHLSVLSSSFQTWVYSFMSGEICQFEFGCSSILDAQRVPGSVCQLSEHKWRPVGHIAQHPLGSTGEQHGPQRGTVFELQLCWLLKPEIFWVIDYYH